MHYLKRDPGHSSVQQWAVQHRQSIEPVTLPLDKHLLTGSPVVVSSVTVLTADELALIFSNDCRIVAVAEKIDTRRSTALGDIHWSTLKLLAPAFREWAKAPVAADSGSGVDVGKLTAERDTLRDRLADMTVELAGLRAGVTGPIAGGDDDEEPVYEPPAEPAPVPQILPEGPALWEATARHFCERSPIQGALLNGTEFLACDDGSVSIKSPVTIGPAVVAGIEDALLTIGLRKRVLNVVAPDAPQPQKPVKSAKAAAAKGGEK